MAEAKVLKTVETPAATKGAGYLPELMAALLTAALISVSIYSLTPPSPVTEGSPPTEFSSARAMKHVSAIAQKPHPLGSVAKAEARDYLFNELTTLGLNPEAQKATAINQDMGSAVMSGNVENILARIKGTQDGPAVLLVAHYDSVPYGPGASDDAASVAALLETARALKAGDPLKNDVIILLTDGEEVGLLGARAFATQHPWAEQVGLVLNFEARGHYGPTIMFETSNNNSWLIRELARAAPYPIANSLSYEVYKNLGRDTDLTVFKNRGYPVLNFAYIGGVNRNHTATDNIENLDQGSLQHSGSYSLSLARHFGNLDLAQGGQGNEVYFDLLGSVLVHYPQSLVMPLALAAALLYFGVLVLGIRRGHLTLSAIALGALAVIVSLAASWLVVTAVWWLLRLSNPTYQLFSMDDVYGSGWFMIGFIALTFAITSATYILFRKKADIQSGGMVWWLVVTLLTSLYVPGASYLFTWPLLFALVARAMSFKGGANSLKQAAVQWLSLIPLLILFPPMVWLIYSGVGLVNSGLVMAIVALGLALLIPQLNIIAIGKKWVLPAASAALAIGLIAVGMLSFGFDSKDPKPNSVFYAVNPDLKRAMWASIQRKPDEWTSQFFSQDARIAPVSEFFPTPNWFLRSDAAVIAAAPPNVTLLDDQVKDGIRTMRLRVTSPRQAPNISLYVECSGELLGGAINEQPTYRRLNNQLAINHFGLLPEGIVVTLQAKTSEPVKVTAVDSTYGLPQAPGLNYNPRPDSMIPMAYRYDDTTLVTKSFSF